MMIISMLFGGLGNHMFQYAAGKSLARKNGTELLLDLEVQHRYPLHFGFELDSVFQCTPKIAGKDQMRAIIGWRNTYHVKNRLLKDSYRFFRGKNFVVEPHFHFWKDFFSLSDQKYIAGYWQSEKYFSAISDEIRNDFEFSAALESLNYEVANSMDQCGSVSVHIRRGDYISNKDTHALLGVCPVDYYERAIAYVAERVVNPCFYFFSDDIAWVRRTFSLPFQSRFVDHNRDRQSFNDMRLMSLCRHHIIANSSFSWWGAWLGRNRDKTVIAPRRWFRRDIKDPKDICPDSWVLL